MQLLSTFLFLALVAPLGLAKRSCGTFISPSDKARAAAHFKSSVRIVNTLAEAPPPINVYFHVITQGELVSDGNITLSSIDAQINVLNHDYAKSGFSFTLANVSHTNQSSWYQNAFLLNEANDQMKQALRIGNASDLNIYTVGFKSKASTGTLGYATQPFDYAAKPFRDGVALQSTSLPGGSFLKYNLGKSATHEVGHWLGLYHTFGIGGCSGIGDEVDDTPMEAYPSYSCLKPRDSCPQLPGDDPVHNFMDYGDDACMNEFTPGQIERMLAQWNVYRRSNGTQA